LKIGGKLGTFTMGLNLAVKQKLLNKIES